MKLKDSEPDRDEFPFLSKDNKKHRNTTDKLLF